MPLSDYDFDLPDGLIAAGPLTERDASRLLVLNRASGAVDHRRFLDWPGLLRRGDVLVLNDTRVVPARLLGRKQGSGGRVELLLVRPDADVDASRALSGPADALSWVCLGQASKGVRPGAVVELEGGRATVLEALGEGELRVRFEAEGSVGALLERAGRVPLPPYVAREPTDEDRTRYQTVYARADGSVAAPTAGLHFTPGTPRRARGPRGRASLRHPRRRSGNFPAGARRGRVDPPDARRALPGPGGDRAGGEPRPRRGPPHRRGGDDGGADAGERRRRRGGCGAGSGSSRLFIRPGVPVPGGRRAAHQLPPARARRC